MFCPNCGKEIRPGGKFCTFCGWKLPARRRGWDGSTFRRLWWVGKSGGGSYRLRSIVDHVEDRTGLREKIEALN